jgi:hypothetical protein
VSRFATVTSSHRGVSSQPRPSHLRYDRSLLPFAERGHPTLRLCHQRGARAARTRIGLPCDASVTDRHRGWEGSFVACWLDVNEQFRQAVGAARSLLRLGRRRHDPAAG